MLPPLFRAPPRLVRDDGRERRIGIEIEFAGLDIEEAISVVTQLYGGASRPKSRFECVVEGTTLGPVRVEIDSKILVDQGYRRFLERLGVGDRTKNAVDDALEAIVTTWVPCEIVTPPLPLTKLPQLEKLREALHVRRALGTKASILYGFAFQLNPELPSFEASSLRRHLQAFLLLYEWLVEVAQVDLTRRIGPFITPFPESYRRKVLAPDYAPDLDRLIADYLEENPTRNRPLDMLPAFATLRPELVHAAVRPKEKINARPTFHYRLPNCMIDDARWSFAVEWNRWCEVERLADDELRLRRLCRDWQSRTLHSELARRAWISEVTRNVG